MISLRRLRQWWTVARAHAGLWDGLAMLRALSTGPVPRAVWRKRMRTCRRCPVLDRRTLACRRELGGNVLGCRCWTPALALTAAPYPTGCWAHDLDPREGWPAHRFCNWRERVRAWWQFIFPPRRPHHITNVKHAPPVEMRAPDGSTFIGHRGDSMCCTCGKHMDFCWDTVCSACGDTSCYAHSTMKAGRWLCKKHSS